MHVRRRSFADQLPTRMHTLQPLIPNLDPTTDGTRDGDVACHLTLTGGTPTIIPRISHLIRAEMTERGKVAVATPSGAGAADKQARMDAVIDEWSSETDSRFVIMKTLPSSTPVAINV